MEGQERLLTDLLRETLPLQQAQQLVVVAQVRPPLVMEGLVQLVGRKALSYPRIQLCLLNIRGLCHPDM